MSVSIFLLLACALCGGVVLAAGTELHRRFRRPNLVRALVFGVSIVLVPLDLLEAFGNVAHSTTGHLLVVVHAIAHFGVLTALLLVLLRLRIPRVPALHPRRVLAIGAHPDDLELACGGSLAKFSDAGHEVHVLVMSAGEQGGHRSERPEEALRAGSFLGVTTLQVLGLPDTLLPTHSTEMVGAIEQAIRRWNPDIILTHSANDHHQDHHAVHLATLRGARQRSSILCYESPSATPTFRPTVYIDIEDYIDVKVAAVRAHRDQQAKPYMSSARLRGVAAFRGAEARTGHAEGYEAVRLLASPGDVL